MPSKVVFRQFFDKFRFGRDATCSVCFGKSRRVISAARWGASKLRRWGAADQFAICELPD